MRTTIDRIRHTVLFEAFAIVICTPLASLILGENLVLIGGLSIVLSVVAMGINYLFNLCFDKALVWFGRSVIDRPVKLRILHAMFFESTMLILTLPVIAWWLDMTLWNAFLTDVGFALFFVCYAFAYNWLYDTVFPISLSNEYV